jgi:hypothetical protein
MKKEIVIKRVYYAANIIDYIFIPIRIPFWILDNWFTEQDGDYYYLSPMTDRIKGLVLEKLSSYSNNSSKKLYLIKTVKTSSNKIITLNAARNLIEHSESLTNFKYAPVLVKNTKYIGGNNTFRIMINTGLVISGIDPSIDSIFTKLYTR